MKYILLAFFCVAWGVLYVSPQINVTSLTLLDDGADYMISKMSYRDLAEEELLYNQRTWPVRLLYRKLLFSFFGLDMRFHYIANGILLGIALYGMYLIFRAMALPHYIAVFFSLIFPYISSFVPANYYRLGTGEPLFVIILLFVVMNFLSQKYKQMSALYGVLLFTKETALFFGPLIIFELIRKNMRWLGIILFVILFAYSTLIVYKLSTGGQYINKAAFGIVSVFSNGHLGLLSQDEVVWMQIICIIGLISVFMINLLTNNITTMILFSVGTIFPMLIWPYDQMHYFLPHYVMLYILSIVLLYRLSTRIRTRCLSFVLFGLLLMYFFVHSFTKTMYVAMDVHRRAVSESALTSYLLERSWSGVHVYAFERAYEANNKMWIYVSKFLNEKVDYFPNQILWVENIENENELSRLITETQTLYSVDPNKKIMIVPYEKRMVCNAPIDICGHSSLVGRVCAYSICTP